IGPPSRFGASGEHERGKSTPSLDRMRVLRSPGVKELDELLTRSLVVPVAIAAVDLQQMIHCTRLVATSREGKREIKPGLVIVRIGADFGLELSDIAASTSLLCQLQRRYDARHIARLSLVRRD